MVTRLVRALGRVHRGTQALPGAIRCKQAHQLGDNRWRYFSATAPSLSGAATEVVASSASAAAVDTATSTASAIAGSADAVKAVAGASNGTPIPGVPFSRQYPDFNVTISSIEDGTANMTFQAMDFMHSHGWEWWAAAGLVTLGLRSIMMPIFFYTVRMGARMQSSQEDMYKFTDMMKEAQRRGDPALMSKARTDYSAYLKANDLHPFRPMLLMGFQIVPFYNLFQGMRAVAAQAHLLPGALKPMALFAFGAPMYLHLPDPTYILPALQTVLGLLSLNLNRNIAGLPQLGLTPGGMRLMFGSLTVLFGFVSSTFPALLQTSFAVTSATMVVQQGLLRLRPLTNLFGFPKEWPVPPEIQAARAAKRGSSGGNPMVDSMRGFEPLFRRASAIAAGQWRPEAKHKYVTILGGLRDPGAPPPPTGAAPSLVSAASVAAAPVGGSVAHTGPSSASGASPGVLNLGPKSGSGLLLNKPKKPKA